MEIHSCVNNWTINEWKNGLCKIKYESKDDVENKEIEEKVIENIKEDMINCNYSYVDMGQDKYFIKMKD